MNTEDKDKIVAIVPRDINECKTLAKDLAASNLLPFALKKKPEDVLALTLAGSELGLAPMQAIRGLNIINGKISMSADLMGALVKRSSVCEYLSLSESSGQVATYRTRRKGEPGETVLSFTAEQAKAAGLSGDNWKKYPDAMLRARALSAICRAVYPDLCLGLYDSESGELTVELEEQSPQRAHVESVKAQLREQVTAPKVKIEIEDAVIIEQPKKEEKKPEATPPVATPKPPTMEERIKAATTLDALKALIPELQKLPSAEQVRLKPIFSARKAEVSGASK